MQDIPDTVYVAGDADPHRQLQGIAPERFDARQVGAAAGEHQAVGDQRLVVGAGHLENDKPQYLLYPGADDVTEVLVGDAVPVLVVRVSLPEPPLVS